MREKINKKAFQSKAHRPLADRCMGYVVNMSQSWGAMGGGVPQVNKFEHVWEVWGSPCDLLWLIQTELIWDQN